MIITRSPLRISLGGGGTDLPSYYEQYDGFCISAAIDQYVYIALHNTTVNEIVLRYSQIEKVQNIKDIRHPIIKAALQLNNIINTNIELTSMANLPAGTGLGSSGSFTTALLKALFRFKNKSISQHQLAEMACHIEIDILKEPIGKQDQFIAAYGGLTSFEFKKDGQVIAKPINISNETIGRLEENLIMIPAGVSRSASEVLKEQNDKSKAADPDMINNLHYVKEMGYRSLELLESGNLVQFGILMHEHWEHKKKRSTKMSNPYIDQIYQLCLENGAVGGKLIGAGASGFLLFYTEDKKQLLSTLKGAGLHDIKIKFDYEGTKIL